MVWTLLAMLALVVTGGFISYYGDLQGRRWGKKRVSWFGMRPKHTAILITSLTGAGIALLTVGVVMIVSPQVRSVVLHGEAVINDSRRAIEQASRKVDAAQIDLKVKTAQLATTEQKLQDYNKQVALANADNARLHGTNLDLEKTNRGLSQGNMELQKQRAALQRSIDAGRKQLAVQKKEIGVQKKEIANAAIINSDLARQNTDYSRQNSELARDNSRLLDTNGMLKTDNANLTMLSKAADKAYNDSLDNMNRLQDQYKDVEYKYNDLKDTFASLKGQIGDLKEQRDDLKTVLTGERGNFVREYIALRQTRYNLRADTELARRTLDAHLSPKAARAEVMALLKDASDRAKRYGAAVGDNDRAVVIVSKRVVTPASVQMADESASVNALVETIAGSNTPVVVVARTINNSAANEQVLMEITPYTSSTIFSPGAVVATRTIDARLPIDKLVESVIVFLKADVRGSALKAGLIPQVSPDTGEQEVGTIDTPELVTLLDRIRRMGGSIQLAAVANEPITSADLLTFGQSKGGAKPHNLRIDLKRVNTAQGNAAPAHGEPAAR